MSENSEKIPIITSQNQGGIFRQLVLSDQLSKIQTYSVVQIHTSYKLQPVYVCEKIIETNESFIKIVADSFSVDQVTNCFSSSWINKNWQYKPLS